MENLKLVAIMISNIKSEFAPLLALPWSQACYESPVHDGPNAANNLNEKVSYQCSMIFSS